jgi:16S rRNA processing protein RimM
MAEPQSSGAPLSPEETALEPEEQAGRQPQWTWLASIRRPQGRKGEVFADILTDFPEKFSDRRRLWLLPESPAPAPGPATKAADEAHPSTKQNGLVSGHDFSRAEHAAKQARALAPEGRHSKIAHSSAPREVELANHWLHKGGVVLHFSGVDSISDAETLAGLIVAIPQAERAPLPEDETYIGDLIGCALVDVAGAAPRLIGEIEDVDRTAGPVALLVVRGTAGEVLVPFAKSYLRKIDLEAKRVEMALPEGLTDLNVSEKA